MIRNLKFSLFFSLCRTGGRAGQLGRRAALGVGLFDVDGVAGRRLRVAALDADAVHLL